MALPSSAGKAPNIFVEVFDDTGAPVAKSVALSSVKIINPPSPALPEVNFVALPLTGTAPLTVAFSDLSLGSPTSWEWDFTNNGSTDSILQNPVYQYPTTGIYSVKLTASNGAGSASLIKVAYIEVSDVPITPLTVDKINFTVDNATLTADMVSY